MVSARRRVAGEISGRDGGKAEMGPGQRLRRLEVPGLTQTSLFLNLTHVEHTTSKKT